MKWVVRGSSGEQEVDVERVAGGFVVELGGRTRRVDLVPLGEVEASLLYADADDNRSYHLSYLRDSGRKWRVAVAGRGFDLTVMTPLEALDTQAGDDASGPSSITATIPGKVVALNVRVGDEVSPGQVLVILEAMKMENELTAARAGRVAAVHVEPGAAVDTGALLMEIE